MRAPIAGTRWYSGLRTAATALAVIVAAAGCNATTPSAAQPVAAVGKDARPRTWAMGFSHMPPRLSTEDAVRGIEEWSRRADIAILHEDVPWKELLAGEPAAKLVARKFGELAALYRRKGLALAVMADATDGLARAKEASALRELKRSLAEPAVQRAYREYIVAVARELKPDYLGVAAETNLVRELAAPALYHALVQSANAAAESVREAGYTGPLLTSVQVETAWGLLPKGAYRGIERDLKDFAFIDALGFSTYPYFAFDDPARVPADYFSRLVAGRSLRVLVTESGWSSANTRALHSSPEMQARYVRRIGELLDSVNAAAYLQLLYADLDVSTYPTSEPETLKLFAAIGLADTRFRPKPALLEWDALRARPLRR